MLLAAMSGALDATEASCLYCLKVSVQQVPAAASILRQQQCTQLRSTALHELTSAHDEAAWADA